LARQWDFNYKPKLSDGAGPFQLHVGGGWKLSWRQLGVSRNLIPPVIAGGGQQAILPATNTAQFFRLLQ
jgi:hypothetical protein